MDIGIRCANPYCDSPDPQMRLPTGNELGMWLNEADEKSRAMVNRGEARLMICEDCGTWTGEGWNEKERRTIRNWVASPFRFQVGDRLRVSLKGRRYGMVGTVTRKDRLAKLIWPPPPPENYYWIVFEKGESEESYEEDNLEPTN